MIHSNKEKGNIVNWGNAKWNVSNMVEYEGTYDKVCSGQEGQNIFPTLQNYTSASTMCQNVLGNLVQLETEVQQQKAVDLLNKSSICSKTPSWIGWSDDDEEGNWVSALNSSISFGKEHFKYWAPYQPDGETTQNCAILITNGRYLQPTAQIP